VQPSCDSKDFDRRVGYQRQTNSNRTELRHQISGDHIKSIDRLREKGLVEHLERSTKSNGQRGTYSYAVTKQQTNKGYFTVDRRVFGMLTPRQMLVYLFLCKSFSTVLHDCWNSYNDIAEQTGMKRETVIQTVNELVAGHFITRIRRRAQDNRRVFVDNLYQIVRYVTGKITKKIKRLYRKYNRTKGLLNSNAIAHLDYNRKERICQVAKQKFPVRGSPQNAALFKYPRLLLS
jgi:predicted transcriptional regulator